MQLSFMILDSLAWFPLSLWSWQNDLLSCFRGVLNKNFWVQPRRSVGELSLEGVFQNGRQNSTCWRSMAHRNNIFCWNVVIVIAYQVLSASAILQSQTNVFYIDVEGASQKCQNIHTKQTLYNMGKMFWWWFMIILAFLAFNFAYHLCWVQLI